MGKLKQIILFLLVVITIYSTLLFYLLMSVHSDSRLQEIDYLEKTKPETQNKVLYIDRLMVINDRLKYFSISRVSHKLPKLPKCDPHHPRQALLLVAASNFDTITIYSKILAQLELAFEHGCLPELFVLKRARPLVLNNQQNINKYANEVGEVIKYFTIEAEIELSIFTHEEGALLTLAYLARKNLSLLYTNIIQKIKTILFVDITHPFLRVEYDPPYKLLHKLKAEILAQKERVKFFNKMKFVVVTTHKEDTIAEHFFYKIGNENLVFAKTLLISSKEMANVHYFLPPNSLSFPPLVRRLAHFLSKDFADNMSITQIAGFLRYGESYPNEHLEKQHFKNCVLLPLARAEFVQTKDQCLEIPPLILNEEEVLMMYSSNHFSVYADNFQKIYPFDNLTEGSIYLFQKMTNSLYVLNRDKSDIMISKQKITSPQNPLKLKQDELLQLPQILFSNYSIVRICPQILLAFPLHFTQGNLHRRFLGQGQEKCFTEASVFENFSWELFLNWSLFRNMVIFTLICSHYRKEPVSDRLIEQFFMNILLLLARDEISNKITCAIYVLSFNILLEYLTRVLLYLVSFLTLKHNWASFALLAISLVCILSSLLGLFNYWKFFILAALLFINKQNLTVLLLKLYFLKDELALNGSGYQGLTNLGLLTMWIYTTLPANQGFTSVGVFWSADHVFTGLLLLTLALALDSSGSMIEMMLTIYMKVLIILRMLRIIRK